MAKKRAFKLTPPDPTEDQLQASIANLLDRILPERVVWTHFPAGGYLLTPAARARLYRLGLKQGFPDLLICYSTGVLWLEVKTPTGNLSPAQRAIHARLRVMGQHVEVVRRIEDVIGALIQYHVPHLKARLAEGYHGTAREGVTIEAQSPAAQPAQSTGSAAVV